jgi:UDP-N-acetyl-D-glucosamine dehydrogenase
MLVDLGAEVRAADPLVVEGHASAAVTRVELTAEEVAGADAVVLLTDHDAFDLDLLADAAVLDTRHVLAPRKGVEYL